MALGAFVARKVTSRGLTFNHCIQVRSPFCFVVLVVLFDTVNDFGFVVIIVRTASWS